MKKDGTFHAKDRKFRVLDGYLAEDVASGRVMVADVDEETGELMPWNMDPIHALEAAMQLIEWAKARVGSPPS